MWESIGADLPAVPRSDLLIATPIDLSFRCVLLQMWTCEMRATAEDPRPGETGGGGEHGGQGGLGDGQPSLRPPVPPPAFPNRLIRPPDTHRGGSGHGNNKLVEKTRTLAEKEIGHFSGKRTIHNVK